MSFSDFQRGERYLGLPLKYAAAPSWTHTIFSYDISCQYIYCALDANFRLATKSHSPKVPIALMVLDAGQNYDDLPDLEPVEEDTPPSFIHSLHARAKL